MAGKVPGPALHVTARRRRDSVRGIRTCGHSVPHPWIEVCAGTLMRPAQASSSMYVCSYAHVSTHVCAWRLPASFRICFLYLFSTVSGCSYTHVCTHAYVHTYAHVHGPCTCPCTWPMHMPIHMSMHMSAHISSHMPCTHVHTCLYTFPYTCP